MNYTFDYLQKPMPKIDILSDGWHNDPIYSNGYVFVLNNEIISFFSADKINYRLLTEYRNLLGIDKLNFSKEDIEKIARQLKKLKLFL